MKAGITGIAILTLAFIAACAPGRAQALWSSPGTGDWETAANWSPASVPDAATDAVIDGGTASVTTSGAAADELWVGKNADGGLAITQGGSLTTSSIQSTILGFQAGVTGSILVSGTNSTFNDGAYYPTYVGYSGTGSLTVRDGGVMNLTQGDLYAGYQAGSSGTITVDAGTISFTSPYGTLYVGSSGPGGSFTPGSGSLLVENGGTVRAYDADIGAGGSATITGSGSSLTTTSGFSIEAGGTVLVENGATLDMGSGGGSNGTITVDGAGTRLLAAQGFNAYGTAVLQNGATASTGDLFLGGSVTVTGTGTAWTVSSGVDSLSTVGAAWALSIRDGASLSVGYDSFVDSTTITIDGANSAWNGSSYGLYGGESTTLALAVQDGGHLNAHDVYLCSGSFTVDGAASLAALANADIGWMQSSSNASGTAAMVIENGATLQDATATVGDHNQGTATVDGDGSTWSNSTSLTIGSSASGTVIVRNGGAVSVGGGTGTIQLKAHGILQVGSGGAAGTVNAATVNLGWSTSQLVFDHDAASYAFAPAVTGSGSIVHQGSGTTVLTGNSGSFTGATTISAGKLLVQGTLGTSGSSVTIASGGAFGGSGTVGGAITLQSGGILAPGGDGGDSSLAGASLTWNGGGQLDFALGTASSLLTLGGALTKGGAGTYLVDLSDAGGLAVGTYTLATFASTTFSASDFGLADPGNGIGGTFSLTSTALRFTVSSVPEPGSVLLSGVSALFAAASLFRARRTRQAAT